MTAAQALEAALKTARECGKTNPKVPRPPALMPLALEQQSDRDRGQRPRQA